MDGRAHARAIAAGSFVAMATGCPAPSVGDDTSEASDTSEATDTSDVTGAGDAWFEIGWGATEFNALENGGDIEVVWGSQGAAMFPLPLRGGGFVLPDDPTDYESPLAPKLDLHIDIEGHNNDIGDHFRYLANYPIVFEEMPDGSYEFLYVAVLMPDGIDPTILEGLPAHLWAQLRPYESEPMVIELDLVVRGGEAPG
jgi:hypothetical protein